MSARHTATAAQTTATVAAEPADSTTTAVAAGTEATPVDAAAEAAAAAEAKELHDNFMFAVTVAIEERDASTGMLSSASLTGPRAAYAACDRKGKNNAKSWLTDQMREALNSAVEDPSQIAVARAYSVLSEQLAQSAPKTGKSPREPREPRVVDVTTPHVAAVAALQLAYSRMFSNPPEGVAEDWEARAGQLAADLASQVEQYAEWVDADEANRPEQIAVDDVAVLAYRLARSAGRKPGGAKTGRTNRSMTAHLAQYVTENMAVGDVATVSDVVSFESTEYGKDNPAAGGVTQRLFEKDGSPRTVDLGDGVSVSGRLSDTGKKTRLVRVS